MVEICLQQHESGVKSEVGHYTALRVIRRNGFYAHYAP